MKKYFVHNGTNQTGPFDLEELKQMQIKSDTPIWYQGVNDWQQAKMIDELKGILSEIPPPITRVNPPIYSTNISKQAPQLNVNLLLVFSILGLCSAFGLAYVAFRLFTIHSAYLNGDEYLTFYCAKTFDQGLFLMGLTLYLLVFSSIILGISVKFRK